MTSKKKLVSIITSIIIILGSVVITQFQKLHNPEQNQTTKQNTATDTSIEENWSYEKYPDYYSVVGKAQIDDANFENLTQDINNPDFQIATTYTGKDELGRTLPVYAITTLKAVQKSSAEKRPDFKQNDNPSGWTKNSKVSIETSTGIYNGWFWNRSHLLADRLGGKATSDNAITGTRMQNVGNRSNSGGMAYIEEKTVDYLRTHRTALVYYAVTPVYKDSELIPRYVIVDAKSNDNVLNERIVVYNYQNGYTLNYKNGKFTKS